MKISETINIAGGNLARPTKFNARVFPPAALTSNTKFKSFDVLCKTVGLPETINEPIEVLVKGHSVKLPGRTNQQQEITITFYLDEFHQLRRVFYNWIAAIDERFYAMKSKQSDILWDFIQEDTLNKYGGIILKTRDFAETLFEPMNYELEYVYPTNVSGFEFNSGGTNEVMEFTVTFAYYRFNHIERYADVIEDKDDIFDI
jgi:hypothetical protein